MSLAIRVASFLLLATTGAYAQLSINYYAGTCPPLRGIVIATVTEAVLLDRRMGASLLRLHFHDCFVNGCDASVLLDDTDSFYGEKNAPPNANSLRGYEVIDYIKAQVEAVCPGVVSCADILALAALEGTMLLGGPQWPVPLGRRDARTTSKDDATKQLPSPFAPLSELLQVFANKGLDSRDMTALSGAHTIGLVRCFLFRDRIYNGTNIDPVYAAFLRARCPTTGGDYTFSPLDVQSPELFDTAYYQNLLQKRGMLMSDQALFNNGQQDWLVQSYVSDPMLFASDFGVAMVKMGNISPLTGWQGEIRRNCRRAN